MRSQGFSVLVCGKYLVLLLFSYLELPTSLISSSNGMFSLYSISQLEKQNTTDSQPWSHFSFTSYSQISKMSFYNMRAKVYVINVVDSWLPAGLEHSQAKTPAYNCSAQTQEDTIPSGADECEAWAPTQAYVIAFVHLLLRAC